jgi:hypothetical protein
MPESVAIRPSPGSVNATPESKSLFASFSSEKEESCSFLKKRTKRLLLPGAGSQIRDLAGKYMVFQQVVSLSRKRARELLHILRVA